MTVRIYSGARTIDNPEMWKEAHAAGSDTLQQSRISEDLPS
jgi:hypothetical protein